MRSIHTDVQAEHWAELRRNSHSWIVNGGGTRATIEGYFAHIEELLQEEQLDRALPLSAALPEICSALEHPRMTTSSAHCLCWCDAWVNADCNDANVYPLARVYLRSEQDDMSDWVQLDTAFTRTVSEGLLRAARDWYLKRGAYDLTVQQNLSRITSLPN